MARIPGIEVDELCLKYKLHPELLDIFVEGEFDRDFLTSLLASIEASSKATVVPVEMIEIPNEYLLKQSLSVSSHKQRLTGLALLLSEKLQGLSSNVTCIIDADHDRLFSRVLQCKHLLYTDYTCMEMYCLNPITLKKFFTLTCNLKQDHCDEFLKLAELILPIQFSMRAVNESLGLNAATISFHGGLTKKKALNSFDAQTYCDSYINQHSLHGKSKEVNAEFQKILGLLPEKLRDKCQGHDFVELIFEYVWNAGGLKLQSKDSDVQKFGGRILTSAIEATSIFREVMFEKLNSAIGRKALLWQV